MKNRDISIIDWLLRIFNRYMESEDWKAVCVVPLYKGKGDRRDCANYREISTFSIPGKLY